MRIVLCLVVFCATQALTAMASAKTPEKRNVASETLTCVTSSKGAVEYDIPKCRSDRAVTVYDIGQGYVKLCCVKN